MKKATMILWVIIFGFIALFIFQNQDFFLAKKNAFKLNLGIREYLIPELNNAVLVLVFFCTGIIIAYLFNFSARFKAKRTIKKLNATIASHSKEIAELKGETNTLKGVETSADGQSDSVKLNMTASRKTAADTTGEGFANKSVRFDADEVTSNSYDDNDTGEIEVKY